MAKNKSEPKGSEKHRASLIEELTDVILDDAEGAHEETVENAVAAHLSRMTTKALEDMHHASVVVPKERAMVVSACLKYVAALDDAKGKTFLDGLPGDWGSKDMVALAKAIEDGDVEMVTVSDED